MKRFLIGLLVTTVTLSLNAKTFAQSINITGDGITPMTLTKGQFADMKQVVVMAKAHDGAVHRYSGITIASLLNQVGILLNDSTKKQTINSYLVVTAADGYKAIYTLAEIDPEFSIRPIILADRADKKPLTTTDGLWQIIVPGEKKYARWVRQVTGIQVVLVK